MEIEKFTMPKILLCSHHIAKSQGEGRRYVKDYEFDLHLEGEREIYLDNVHYRVSKGSLIFRKPGQLTIGSGDYNTYILNLDFSHKVNIAPQDYLRHRGSADQELCPLDLLEQIPAVFFPAHQEDLAALYEKIISCSYPNMIDKNLQQKYIGEFLFLVFADAFKYNRESSEPASAPESYIKKACNYINKNYAKHLSVEEIADYLSLNQNYLIRLFKKEMNITPNKYISETRLFYARQMLLQTQLSVQDIAIACGFNTTSYFIKCYRERFGESPLAYKNGYFNATSESYR